MAEERISEKERNRRETEKLYQRADRCVCKMCGNKLTPGMIIYNKYGGQGMDLYCPHCQQTEYGTEKEIYYLANKFVDTFEFNYFLDMEENRRNEMLNISKICEIMAWTLKQIGLVDKDGLKMQVPVYPGPKDE